MCKKSVEAAKPWAAIPSAGVAYDLLLRIFKTKFQH